MSLCKPLSELQAMFPGVFWTFPLILVQAPSGLPSSQLPGPSPRPGPVLLLVKGKLILLPLPARPRSRPTPCPQLGVFLLECTRTPPSPSAWPGSPPLTQQPRCPRVGPQELFCPPAPLVLFTPSCVVAVCLKSQRTCLNLKCLVCKDDNLGWHPRPVLVVASEVTVHRPSQNTSEYAELLGELPNATETRSERRLLERRRRGLARHGAAPSLLLVQTQCLPRAA